MIRHRCNAIVFGHSLIILLSIVTEEDSSIPLGATSSPGSCFIIVFAMDAATEVAADVSL